ncbi:hypothetical protein K2W90_00820 [Candidatus Babeliales bacterium]|nr:hypothetical protein [Candidatus Babeliales bacterium]
MLKQKNILLAVCFFSILPFSFLHAATLGQLTSTLGALKSKLAVLTQNLATLSVATPAATPLVAQPTRNPAYAIRPRAQFFQDVMGISETDFRHGFYKTALSSETKNGQQIYFIKNNAGKKYQCGYFEQLSIGALRAATAAIDARDITTMTQRKGTFSVMYGIRADIQGLQGEPKNQDTVFQVASNFNGLETIEGSPTAVTDMNAHTLQGYESDHTQGPFASISATPGLILRRYYAFYPGNETAPSENWWQGNAPARQVNFLSDLMDTIGMTQGGYVLLHNAVAAGTNPTNEDLKKMKIGFHGETQATFGHIVNFPNNQVVLQDPLPIINQVFTAGVNFYATNTRSAIADAWAQTILNAAYEGTIRAAAYKNKKNVVLTLIGGGVFGNPKEWIVAAIERMKDFIVKSGIEVWLNVFGDELSTTEKTRMKAMTTETGGKFLE